MVADISKVLLTEMYALHHVCAVFLNTNIHKSSKVKDSSTSQFYLNVLNSSESFVHHTNRLSVCSVTL